MDNHTFPYLIESETDFMRLCSPAKVNLFLHVTGKRPDGYHDLVSLMCPVSLFDTLSLKFGGTGIRIACPHPAVPDDETNLVWRAADIFFRRLGRPGSVEIFLDKQIPVAAGLGGGSSNAASVLMALNHHHGFPFSQEQLMETGLELGADVPFFIFGKPALATGVGEQLEIYNGLDPLDILLVAFDFTVSTAWAYKKLNLGLTKLKKINKSLAFKNQGFDARSQLYNDLESVTASTYPDIPTAKKALLDHGASGVLMSGSGPTVFGLFPDRDRAVSAKSSLSKNGRWRLYLVRMIV